uniref:Uncharacterized protein n=1 Tax=Brassica oleracea TaxID=3712 RepID=A0A3P6FCN7_BRAOL|nr:unnamed protein product [Brassica oleracea]
MRCTRGRYGALWRKERIGLSLVMLYRTLARRGIILVTRLNRVDHVTNRI